ncbi:diguanylate cyclase/phosphodiesterase with PAS/PAC sensor(s) [Cyanobacterium stanieri PCC 7202]|uniref:Diguanylate cyclase/phosphodiesterase with PAS/PAC sensor(S) n=1 Tax=Cyanobacterium stanieri (strain ATCC 29140 / PCC 7202) TaxID=292563 RepID=K9YJC2_CYASC|nr:diguanylate cyclase/phosphodiesterase with PAS/PAC sensor(s) [Cyanobacterium stanieri PCC 7202]
MTSFDDNKGKNSLLPLINIIDNGEKFLLNQLLQYSHQENDQECVIFIKENRQLLVEVLSQIIIDTIINVGNRCSLKTLQIYLFYQIKNITPTNLIDKIYRQVNFDVVIKVCKYYRYAYLEIIDLAIFYNYQKNLFNLFIHNFFDCIEIYLSQEWSKKQQYNFSSNLTLNEGIKDNLSFLESFDDGILLLDQDFNLLNINTAVKKLFGIEQPDSLFSHLYQDYKLKIPWLTELFKHFTQQHKSEFIWQKQVDSNLGLIWLEIRIIKVFYADTDLFHFLIICRNIDTLIHTQQKLGAIANYNINGLMVTDEEGKVLFLNPACKKIFAGKANQMFGELFGIPLASQKSTEIIIPYKEGKILTVKMDVTPIKWENQKAYLITFIDITKRKEIEEQFKFLHQASEQSPASIMITDNTGKIQYVNSKFETITGYTREEVIGQNPRILKSGETTKEEYQKLWETISHGKEWHGEFHNRKKNGELFWEIASISPIKDEYGFISHYVAVKEDITEKKRQEELLSHQANYDYLTELPNRLLGMERLKQEIAKANRNNLSVALIFLDLDNFKNINDTLGHQYGDELLIVVAQRLQECLRKSDTVARLGGDEFLIIISSLSSPSQGEIIASKLLYAMRNSFTIAGEERFISASIGITFYPQDGDNIQNLIQNADLAMYAAKRKGKNNFKFFNSRMNEVAQKKMQQETYLRQALKNDELFLVYQPIIDLKTKKIVGVESLMRWHNSILGNVSTIEFISIAEETGLITDLGKWLLESVCQQLADWQQQGIYIYASINLSPRQFRDVNLVDIILEMTEKYHIKPHYLKLEITEQLLVEDIPSVQGLLFNLSHLGFELYLDDFGTGYSSLSYLRKYPFKVVKIDRSFVLDMEESDKGKALIKTMIAMAYNLNLSVIAEGIETINQLKFLEAENCCAGQGYLFSRPLLADNLLDFIADNF